MSTKIYNAFLIECVDYNQLFEIIQNMKKYCNETLYNEYFQQLIEFKVEIEDMLYLKKENPKLHWELEEVFYKDSISKDLLRQSEVNKLPYKNFRQSFDNEIIIFESFAKPHFDQNAIFPEHINNQGMKSIPVIVIGKEAFDYAKKHFKDFHYQDQTDKPEEIFETDWLFREKTWQNRLKTGIPSVDGLEIKLCDESSVYRLHLMNIMKHGIKKTMEKYKNEHPLEERIQKYLRKKEQL